MKATQEPATIEQLTEGSTDGAPMIDVAFRFEKDGRIEQASMRPDLVPVGLTVGDRVLVTRAALYKRWTITRADE